MQTPAATLRGQGQSQAAVGPWASVSWKSWSFCSQIRRAPLQALLDRYTPAVDVAGIRFPACHMRCEISAWTYVLIMVPNFQGVGDA